MFSLDGLRGGGKGTSPGLTPFLAFSYSIGSLFISKLGSYWSPLSAKNNWLVSITLDAEIIWPKVSIIFVKICHSSILKHLELTFSLIFELVDPFLLFFLDIFGPWFSQNLTPDWVHFFHRTLELPNIWWSIPPPFQILHVCLGWSSHQYVQNSRCIHSDMISTARPSQGGGGGGTIHQDLG